MGYDHHEIEMRWQTRWDAEGLYTPDLDTGTVYYNLVEFPYPSAEGLHVGNVKTYTGADVHGRYRRMRGDHVFQPIGFDAFGIHTENYALKLGEHPRAVTERTTANFRRQLRSFGAGWDWSRELRTSDPSYYRWTQWIFLRLHEAELAYRDTAPVVWCPSCLTVLAHEQLEGEACERCGTRVTERVMEQWFLRLTRYADALADGLDDLDWPAWAKRTQREWIGRSRGVEVDFEVPDLGITLSTFTTRVDTLYGATFLAIATSHPQIDRFGDDARAFVERPRVTEDRFAYTTDGVDTGVRARHPLTGDPVPVFVADYVVAGYGTAAVMGVPAHDERDHAFAEEHGLEVRRVIAGGDELPYTGEGGLVSSGQHSGLPSDEARDTIADALEAEEAGRRATRYRLRDWLISRQRYWGPPIPIVHCPGCGTVPVPDDELPVLLPETDDVHPTGTGRSPLANILDFVETTCPRCGSDAHRETDVSDTFLDSAWYFLRYTSTEREGVAWDPERVARVMPVDRYEGGREHLTRHHLYARFLCHALGDLGLLDVREPFPRMSFHGHVHLEGRKMSKSGGNVVNPDTYVDEVGQDVLRMALLFTGPWEEGGTFSDAGVRGIVRFRDRIWRLFATDHVPGGGGVDLRPLDRFVARVTADVESYRFHTAIAALHELISWAEETAPQASASEWGRISGTTALLLAPFAPYLAEELWSRLGGGFSVHTQDWPSYDPRALELDEITLVVQVDGKTRDTVTVPSGLDEQAAVRAALGSEKVRRHLPDGDPSKVVYVPDRLVNLVT